MEKDEFDWPWERRDTKTKLQEKLEQLCVEVELTNDRKKRKGLLVKVSKIEEKIRSL